MLSGAAFAGAGTEAAGGMLGGLGGQGAMQLVKSLGGRAIGGLFGWPGMMLALGLMLGGMGGNRPTEGMAESPGPQSDDEAANMVQMLAGEGGNKKKDLMKALMMMHLAQMQQKATQTEGQFAPRGSLIPDDQIAYLP